MKRLHRLAALTVLPFVLLSCGSGGKATERTLTDDQLVLMSTVFYDNHLDKGANFVLNTVSAPGGAAITMQGQVDFVNHLGYATVTGGAQPHPVTQVLWGPNVVLERRPSASAELADLMGRRIEFVARTIDTAHRRLDAIIATINALAMKTPENVQLLRQKEGSAFLRNDVLRGTDVLVMRYGRRVILWVDPVSRKLLRFEGNSANGAMPIIVDLVERVAPRIPSPKKELTVPFDELGAAFLRIAPTSP